jgi:hypothetical protein
MRRMQRIPRQRSRHRKVASERLEPNRKQTSRARGKRLHRPRSHERVSILSYLCAFSREVPKLITSLSFAEGPRVEVEYEQETEPLSAAQMDSW